MFLGFIGGPSFHVQAHKVLLENGLGYIIKPWASL